MVRDRFPLWLHPTGQWCKKHRGTFHYFGTDQDEALKRFAAEWDDIKAGRKGVAAVSPAADLTVEDLADLFLTAKQSQVDSGELTPGVWANYRRASGRVIAVLGKARAVGSLTPADFGRIRAEAARTLGPNSLTHFLALARGMFRYGAEVLDRPVRYGGQFDRPPRRLVRLHRERKGKRLIPAADLRALLAAARPTVRAQVLLGINCAFGATDCSELTRTDLAARPGWVELVRRKTGVARRCPLWPETVRALGAAIPLRAKPIDPADADRVFLTAGGYRCVRFTPAGNGKKGSGMDVVAGHWRALCRRVGVKVPSGFYTLRHVFRTVADEVRDRPATDIIMGHADESMAAFYIEEVKDERLVAVVEYVRRWLKKSS